MKWEIKNLQKRLNELAGKRPLHAEPRPWFGFHAPVHPYDPPNVKFDIFNRNAWRWFCYLQMTPIELDECMSIDVWNADNKHPLVTYGTAPDLRNQAQAFHDRCQELEVVAQGRAEELDRRDAEAYPRWKEFYRELEKQNQDRKASDEPAELVDDSRGKRIRLLWAWQLEVLEAYRKCEKEHLEGQES